jgi:hypothetical protein
MYGMHVSVLDHFSSSNFQECGLSVCVHVSVMTTKEVVG